MFYNSLLPELVISCGRKFCVAMSIVFKDFSQQYAFLKEKVGAYVLFQNTCHMESEVD